MLVGPRLLILYQPPGIDYSEQVVAHRRDTCVSLYCRPQFLADILRRNGIHHCPVLEEIERHDRPEIWHKTLPLSGGLTFVARSLLDNPFRKGIRLLHAEAKALDLLCEVLHVAEENTCAGSLLGERVLNQLEAARQILGREFARSPSIPDIARAVGMSQIEAQAGVQVAIRRSCVFEYGFECRMAPCPRTVARAAFDGRSGGLYGGLWSPDQLHSGVQESLRLLAAGRPHQGALSRSAAALLRGQSAAETVGDRSEGRYSFPARSSALSSPRAASQ